MVDTRFYPARFGIKKIAVTDFSITFKGKNYPIEYFVRWVGWVVSYKRLERAKEHLKRELLKRAIQRAEDYGKLLKSRCSVKTLSFRDWFNPYPLRVGNVIAPKREGEVVKISTLAVFGCR